MKIAVIGGIGSGKSEVMKVAKEMGITCLSADEINDALLHEPVYISKIASRFPECVAHGAVDKPKLASVVFSDEKKRRALNDIAHPEIARRIAECDADPLAVELPLALESGMATAFDEVILVSAPKSLRLNRLERRGVPEARANAVMRVQVPEKELEKIATVILPNDGSLSALRAEAKAAFEKALGKRLQPR